MNMDSNAAELVIIACFTNKPIDNIIAQKSCLECEAAEEVKKTLPPEQHRGGVCYRNVPRNTSSKSMEPDLAREAFSRSEEKHGVVYLEYVADGDTDIHSALYRHVHYGHDIRYIPCANHHVKCFRSGLEKIAKEKPRYESALGFNLEKRAGITANARCTIKFRHNQYYSTQDPKERAEIKEKLSQDLLYGWLHKMGHHDYCSPDWCKVALHIHSKQDKNAKMSKDIDYEWLLGSAEGIEEPSMKRSRVKPASAEEKKRVVQKDSKSCQ